MQQAINRDREQRFLDIAGKVLRVYLVLFAVALVALAVLSPVIARDSGGWVGLPFAVIFGIAGLAYLGLEVRNLWTLIVHVVAKRSIQQRARRAEQERLTSALTSRPAVRSAVRVLEPTWTPFGVIQPGELGTVLDFATEDDDLVHVRWSRGESIHDFRHLAPEV